MRLFLDTQPLVFEKTASREHKLPDNPADWPQAILDELYRQAPYTSDYSPNVVIRDLDADKRYALGFIELVNRLAINPRDDNTPPGLKGQQKVIVPVVVREGRLLPLDLLVNKGAIEPLTEERLRRALFRPVLFEALQQRPGDLSIIEQLYPPNRQFGGARGPLITDAGPATGEASVKTSSVHPGFLFDAIAPTIRKAHIEEALTKIGSDEALYAAYVKNDATRPFLQKLAALSRLPEPSPSALVKEATTIVMPNVLQVRRVPSGFMLKMANSNALLPQTETLSRPDAIATLGQDLVSRVEQDGTVTVTTTPAVKQSVEDLHIAVIDSFGLYKVRRKSDNKELVGWVFPTVMDLGGEVLPLAVFGNGSESAIQEHIAGVSIARQVDVIDATPEGDGMFYITGKSGAVGIVPVTVEGTTEVEGRKGYLCTTIMGSKCTIVRVSGLRGLAQIDEKTYAIPIEAGFMPLPNKVVLAESPEEFVKVSAAKAYNNAVRVLTDGQTFSLEGRPIDKLAGILPTQFVDLDDVVFAGAVLGADPEFLKTACLKLKQYGHGDFWFETRPVTLMREKYAEAKRAAVEFLRAVPDLRVMLVKEAAPLLDPTSVDKVLSIGFLNPENLSIFVEYIPDFEETIKHLSELLLASRLGLSVVDSTALERAIAHLDKVVAGLKTVSNIQA